MTAALHVDLDALARNLAFVRDTVAPAELMLVLKDDAYGHGLEAVVVRAAREGVQWFGAFDVATGRAARGVLGLGPRIFVWMTASADEVAEAVGLGLEVGVGDAVVLEEAADAGRHHGAPARIHLKIDTGLHRNGVRPEQWGAFVARAAELEAAGSVRVVGIWSHIAEASDAEDDAARALFEEALQVVGAAGLSPTHRHLAASAAAFARPEFRYDLVRIGAFAYGVRSAGGAELPGLELVSRLSAEVTRVTSEAVHLGVGALDGLPSSLSGHLTVATPAGPRNLLVGADESLIAGGWPEASVGDVVTVFGPGENEKSPTDLAEAIESVGEEILVRLSPLVPRRYASRQDGLGT